MGALRTFLIEHPALVWLLGFKLVADPSALHGLNSSQSVPSRRQLSRALRDLPNDACQFLLDSTIQLIRDALPPELAATFGHVVAGDTKHILAWVKENNPKQYIKEGRFDPSRQPKGDPDCTLGAKKRRNVSPDPDEAPPPAASRHRQLKQLRLPRSAARLSTTGAMPPVWSPVSFLSGAKSYWPSARVHLTRATSAISGR
jgi:hypothetical protein